VGGKKNGKIATEHKLLNELWTVQNIAILTHYTIIAARRRMLIFGKTYFILQVQAELCLVDLIII